MTARFIVSVSTDRNARPCLRFQAENGQTFTTAFNQAHFQDVLCDVQEQIKALVKLAKQAESALESLYPQSPDITAVSRVKRGAVDILPTCRRLRSHILGADSLGAHAPLQKAILLAVDRNCAHLPWELLEDHYGTCLHPDHHRSLPIHEHEESGFQCLPGHEIMVSKGPLAVRRQLGITYTDWQENAPPVSSIPQAPNKALIVGTPTALDKLGHLELLEGFLSLGYVVTFLTDPNVKRSHVLSAMEDPDCRVIYFFGHGKLADDARSSRITLANKESLSLADLPRRLPGRPLIFLNCCWSGLARWSEATGAIDSLAGELLQRGAVAVISAVCEIVPSQAAAAAVMLFYEALRKYTIGCALQGVRNFSFEKYLDGEPHLSWFSYRLYGDPNCRLRPMSRQADGSWCLGPFSQKEDLPSPVTAVGACQKGVDPGFLEVSLAAMLTTTKRILPFLASGLDLAPSTLPGKPIKPQSQPPTAVSPGPAEALEKLIDEKKATHRNNYESIYQWVVSPKSDLYLSGDSVKRLTDRGYSLAWDFMKDVRALSDGMTTGAAFIIEQIRKNALECGPNSSLPHLALAAFLQHPLIYSEWRRQRPTDNLEQICCSLLLVTADTSQGVLFRDSDDFIARLLQKSRVVTGGTRALDEWVLFAVARDLAGWRAS